MHRVVAEGQRRSMGVRQANQLAVDLCAHGHLNQFVVHIAFDPSLGREFNVLTRVNISFYRPIHDDPRHPDFTLNRALLANRQGCLRVLLCRYVAVDGAVDVQAPTERDIAGENRLITHQRVDARGRAFLFAEHSLKRIPLEACIGDGEACPQSTLHYKPQLVQSNNGPRVWQLAACAWLATKVRLEYTNASYPHNQRNPAYGQDHTAGSSLKGMTGLPRGGASLSAKNREAPGPCPPVIHHPITLNYDAGFALMRATTRPRNAKRSIQTTEPHMYLWLKALHVISMVTWFAGLFYLPRLFVYHTLTQEEPGRERFKIMERKLYRGIMTPSAVLTILFGGAMLWLMGREWLLGTPWLQIKLLLVGVLLAYHAYLGSLVRIFARDLNQRGHVFYRWINEFPVLILVAVVILAIVKPA